MTIREINLVPFEVLQKKNVVRRIFMWACCLILCLGVILGYYQYQIQVVLPQKRPLTTLEDMQVKLGSTLEEIRATQQELQRLSFQDSFIKKLATNQHFSGVLLKLSNIMNSQTWLTRLTIDADTKEETAAPEINLYGFSVTNDDLGSFLTRLSEEPLFQNMALKYAQETELSRSPQDQKTRVKVIQFHIDGNLLKVPL